MGLQTLFTVTSFIQGSGSFIESSYSAYGTSTADVDLFTSEKTTHCPLWFHWMEGAGPWFHPGHRLLCSVLRQE